MPFHHASPSARRSLLAAITAAAACLICSTACADTSSMFRGGLAHPGVYDSPAVATLSGVKWTFHTQGQILSSPAIAGNTVYVGSTDGDLYAVDRADGSLKWKFATDARVTSSPAVVGGVVYFGSYDGNVYALDAATGHLKWKFATDGERRFAAKHIHGFDPVAETMPDIFDVYLSSPAVWDGTVYVGSGDRNVYALDAASGRLKWKFATGDVVHASPAIADGTVFIGSWDSYFYALDAMSGAVKWKYKTGVDPAIFNQVGIQSSAAVENGVVYFGCRDSKLYALDEATGTLKWLFANKGSWVVGSPAVRGDDVVFATSDSGLFYDVDAHTGAPRFVLSFDHWPMFSSPALAGRMAYIGSHAGKLLAIDLDTGKLAWSFRTPASLQNGAALTKADGSPNYEAVMTENFYDVMVSATAHMATSMGSILSSPAVADHTIYFGAADGNLYAID
jgi:outer membrane protein assembly factor BamB